MCVTLSWLTSEVDGNARSFRHGSVRWDYAANQISGILTLPPFGTAVYDMGSGALLSVTDEFGREQNSTYLFDVKANANNERYPCRQSGYGGWYMDGVRIYYQPENKRIVMTDAGSRELLHVVLENVETPRYDGSERWLPNCRYLMLKFGRYGLQETLVVDMATSERVFSVKNTLIRGFEVDPSGTFAVVSTRLGSSLLYIPTGTQHVLNPQPHISPYGTGSVYTYFGLNWDLANNQVRMRDYNSLIRVYDLTTGYLVALLDSDGNPTDEGTLTAVREQIGAPYGCRFKIEYQAYNQRLVIRDPVTHALIAVVEDHLPVDGFHMIGRSPDCHYIAGALGTEEDRDTIVWDLNTLTRVGVFENAVKIPHPLEWSPYGGYVVVNTRDGGYLWHLPSDTRTKLNSESIEIASSYYFNNEDRYVQPYYRRTIRSFHYLEWDMSSGQLLAVPVERNNVVIAYDLATGQPVAEYGVGQHTGPVKFLKYDDDRLIVYSDVSSGRPSDGGLALWNRNTGEGIQLAMDYYVKPYYESSSYYHHSRPQFSPDDRYLLLTSTNYLYVWDLGALAGSAPHLPNVTIKVPGADTAQFIDNMTIETVDFTYNEELRQRRLYRRTKYHWDAATGELSWQNSQELRRR